MMRTYWVVQQFAGRRDGRESWHQYSGTRYFGKERAVAKLKALALIYPKRRFRVRQRLRRR